MRALLAILAADPSRVHTRAQLAGLLWGDLPESTAKQNLRQALFNLRQAIGDANADPPYLLISRHDIQINPGAEVTCDAAQLWQQLRQTTTEAAHGQSLIALYRGKFLSSLFVDDSAAFEEWAEIQRESLHQRVLTALDKLTEAALNSDAETALNLAQQQLALDTWHEPAHRNVMRAMQKLGRNTEALAQFAKCSQILQAELGVPPSAETIALYQHIRNTHQNNAKTAQNSPATQLSPSFRPTLPTPPTPFIGREREQAEALALLKDPACRLLSLVGPGGVGKTRLAIALAQSAPPAVFVGLASAAHATTPNPAHTAEAGVKPAYAIAQAIAQTLKIPFSVEKLQLDAIVQPLLNVLNGQTLTLVLDNIEHLIAGAGLLASLLTALPQLKIIATSRERLNLRDEWTFALGGLNVPAESIAMQDLGKHSATQLFLQAARRASGTDRLDRNDASHIVRVCRMVDGLPLGIELAAAWTRMLTPSEIVQEIEQDLNFLSTHSPDLPDRHRSMTAVFDYSWNLLSPIEQRIFCQLGLFAQSFSREAAAQIAGASLLRLTGLVDKSLVQRSDAQRYQLHQLLRRFAEAKLRERPDLFEACRQRHCQFFAQQIENQAGDLVGGPRQKLALDAVAAEQDNLRMAWAIAIAQNDLASIIRLLDGTFYFYELRSWFREGAETFAKAADALERISDGADAFNRQKTLAELYARRGYLLNRLGEVAQAQPLLDRAMTLFEQLGVLEGQALVANARADIAYSCGDYAAAQAHYERAERHYRQLGHGAGLARVLVGLGNVWAARETDDFEQSGRCYSAGLYEARMAQNRVDEARALLNLGTIAHAQHNHARARELFEQAIAVCQDTGDRRVLAIALTNLSDVHERNGNLAEARQTLEQSLQLKREIGHLRGLTFSLNSLGELLNKMGERQAAKQRYREALQLALTIQAVPAALVSLIDLGGIAAQEGQTLVAAEILAYVRHHSALEQFQRHSVETEFERLIAALSPEARPRLAAAEHTSLPNIAALALSI